MPVHPSRHADIGALIAQLSHADPVVRESSAARLVVLGERAVPAVRALLRDADASSLARIGALRTLVAISRADAIDAAAACVVDSNVPLALDAVDLLGDVLSDAADPAGADRALEHLTRLALDTTAAARRRLLVMEPLSRLPIALKKPIFDVLANDSSPEVATHAMAGDVGPRGALERWTDDDRLPPTPEALADAIAADGEQTPITALRRLVELARARENGSQEAGRGGWRATRGLLHEALARRGSVIARYDLRETLEESHQPVTAPFLTAALTVADATCLDAIAARWVHAGQDVWLRDQLERIFHAIVSRERLRRSSPQLTRVLKRHPAAGPLVATAPRTRPPAT